ncbi:MAG: penicillin-binding protein 2 [Coriobacteriia bacterium]|nr:penicillin-binding protein 2 [Coriobacteriia bacterium]
MAFFVVVIGILAAQLWSMQIIQGAEFSERAAANRLREATTIAPRGRILDRHGAELIGNRTTMVVLAPAQAIEDDELVERLSTHLMVAETDVRERIGSVKDAPLDMRVVAIDVPMDTISYIAENQALFPDIEVAARAVRTYPQGAIAAQLLGYAGIISETDFEDEIFTDYHSGDIVGKSGVEYSFETVLQGVRGRQLIEVDAHGRPQRVVEDIPPQAGQDVVLTLDTGIQRATEDILQRSVEAGRDSGENTIAAAAVVIEIQTGEIIALASNPTFDPEQFVGGISSTDWEALNDEESHFPLINRAISAAYPPASTFKAFVGLGGIEYSIAETSTVHHCAGAWNRMGQWDVKNCWNRLGHGMMDMRDAVAHSCNVYFYNIGYDFDVMTDEALQAYLREWGYGQLTGIDVPGEVAGRIPTADWKAAWSLHNPGFSGTWVLGDTVNLSIGQGDVLTTPLQVATTYAGIANHGHVMRPHVLRSVLDARGVEVLTTPTEVAFEPSVSPESLAWMNEYLRDVVTDGTARPAFRGFPIPVSGKTGTAEMPPKDDSAWFVGYAPAEDPIYCVAVFVEQGGAGGVTASPAARAIIGAIFGADTSYRLGTDRSR